jgi:lysophospholipase L1-like esterase
LRHKQGDLVDRFATYQALARSPDWSTFTGWLDLTPGFVDASGLQMAALFTDGLHPNQTGYRIWRDRLLPFLETERHNASAATATTDATSIPGKCRI